MKYSVESLQPVLPLQLLQLEHERRQAVAVSSWRQLTGDDQLQMPAFHLQQDQVLGVRQE